MVFPDNINQQSLLKKSFFEACCANIPLISFKNNQLNSQWQNDNPHQSSHPVEVLIDYFYYHQLQYLANKKQSNFRKVYLENLSFLINNKFTITQEALNQIIKNADDEALTIILPAASSLTNFKGLWYQLLNCRNPQFKEKAFNLLLNHNYSPFADNYSEINYYQKNFFSKKNSLLAHLIIENNLEYLKKLNEKLHLKLIKRAPALIKDYKKEINQQPNEAVLFLQEMLEVNQTKKEIGKIKPTTKNSIIKKTNKV